MCSIDRGARRWKRRRARSTSLVLVVLFTPKFSFLAYLSVRLIKNGSLEVHEIHTKCLVSKYA